MLEQQAPIVHGWISVSLATLLVFAGVSKSLNPRRLSNQFVQLGLRSKVLAILAPYMMIAFELGIALWLLLWPDHPWAYSAGLLLIGVFSLFVIWVILTGRKLSCMCFGGHDQPIGVQTLVRNAIILIGFAIGLGLAWSGLGDAIDGADRALAIIEGVAFACLFIAYFETQPLSSGVNA